MNNIDKLTQKIFSKFNDDSLFYCNIYLTGTEENNAVVLFDMEGFVLKVSLTKLKPNIQCLKTAMCLFLRCALMKMKM